MQKFDYFMWMDAGLSRFFNGISSYYPSQNAKETLIENKDSILIQASMSYYPDLVESSVCDESYFWDARSWIMAGLWGGGSPRREFLHVDDLAEACFICMKDYNSDEIINVGTREDITIKELANIISSTVGYEGEIFWDEEKPNGTPRKVLNIEKIKSLGWKPNIDLYSGITKTYDWFKENVII